MIAKSPPWQRYNDNDIRFIPCQNHLHTHGKTDKLTYQSAYTHQANTPELYYSGTSNFQDDWTLFRLPKHYRCWVY